MFGDKGGIVTVVGLFASGKTSLIDGVLRRPQRSTLEMLPNYTTRLPRNRVEKKYGSMEYRFVNEMEYNYHRTMSQKWYERTASNVKYGIDVAEIEANVSNGVTYLSTMLPHAATLREQREVFRCPIFQILIDVPVEVCNQRLFERGHELESRLTLQRSLDVDACRLIVDTCFAPIGTSLDADIDTFCQYFN